MKAVKQMLAALLPLMAGIGVVMAQDNSNPPPDNQPPPDQQMPGGPGRHRHRPPPPVMLALDANHDGVIDSNEIANASVALKTLDKNGDGQLTLDELLPPPPNRNGADRPEGSGDAGQPGPGFGKGHHPPLPPVVVALDANHDGVIDASEIANAPEALKTLDKNGDGQLTREELRPPRPPMNHPHDGQSGPGNPGSGSEGDEPPPPPPQD